jgi:hypothetical protein
MALAVPTVSSHTALAEAMSAIRQTNPLVTSSGQSAQLGCVKHVFTDGFTVGITE